jgi:hypothetical protein
LDNLTPAAKESEYNENSHSTASLQTAFLGLDLLGPLKDLVAGDHDEVKGEAL